MRAREYSDRIEIWASVQEPDGYGGTTPETETMLFKKWAQIRTQGVGRKFQEFGLNEFVNPVMFRVRKGNNIIRENMFVVYDGMKFVVRGVENVNLDDRFLNILCDSIQLHEEEVFTFVLADENRDTLVNENDNAIIAK